MGMFLSYRRKPKCSWLWDWMNAQADAHRDRNVSRLRSDRWYARRDAAQGLVSAIQNAGNQYRPSNHLSQLPEVLMTVVITYLAKDNAKARYRARRAAKHEQMEADARLARKIAVASTGCSLTVSRAINSPSLRSKHESGSACLPEVAQFAAGFRNTKSITAR